MARIILIHGDGSEYELLRFDNPANPGADPIREIKITLRNGLVKVYRPKPKRKKRKEN